MPIDSDISEEASREEYETGWHHGWDAHAGRVQAALKFLKGKVIDDKIITSFYFMHPSQHSPDLGEDPNGLGESNAISKTD